jgi:hypothetical protein
MSVHLDPARKRWLMQAINLLTFVLLAWLSACQSSAHRVQISTEQVGMETPTRTPFRPLFPMATFVLLPEVSTGDRVLPQQATGISRQSNSDQAVEPLREAGSRVNELGGTAPTEPISPTIPPMKTDKYPQPTFPATRSVPLATSPPLEITSTAPLVTTPTSVEASAPTPVLEPALEFYGIDFGRSQRVEIKITPPNELVNKGKPIKISFIPGNNCRFGTRRGCVYAYKPTYNGNVLLITVHSGVGGEAQRWRSALEGTGINRAGNTLEQTLANMRAFENARVVIRQGEQEINTARLGPLVRIPASALDGYFDAQLAEVLSFAARYDTGIVNWIFPEQPIIVLETCGWKMPGEPGAEGLSDTTGSIYLAVIRQQE